MTPPLGTAQQCVLCKEENPSHGGTQQVHMARTRGMVDKGGALVWGAGTVS
jgi:hypothetical protein